MNKNNTNEKAKLLPEIRSFKGNIETYNITDTIQDSLYGKVYEGYGTKSGKMVAIKVLNKNDIITKEMNRLLPETPLAEVFFAEEMSNHEYLATIRDVFETEYSHCIVSDLADGEDLLELLKKNRYGLEEKKARICMKQAAIALNKCHERGFALQDFSLENCLLYRVDDKITDNVHENENSNFGKKFQIKVCDPGQAVRFGRNNDNVEIPVPYLGCIGKKFRPPEIFLGKPYIASKVDSWCLGWSTFYLLFGIELFESVHQIDNDIRWQWYSLGYRDYLYSYLDVKDKLSDIARSFIESLVNVDPMKRMSVKQALEHPFLKDIDEKENLLLKDWGRELKVVDTNENIKESILKIQECSIPFIPEIYKKKYLKLYCTKDKPSGYYPNQVKSINFNRKKGYLLNNDSNCALPVKPLVSSRPKQINNINFFQKRVQSRNNLQMSDVKNFQYNNNYSHSNNQLNMNIYKSNNIQNWPLNNNNLKNKHCISNVNFQNMMNYLNNSYQSLPVTNEKQFFQNNPINNINSMLFLSCNLNPNNFNPNNFNHNNFNHNFNNNFNHNLNINVNHQNNFNGHNNSNQSHNKSTSSINKQPIPSLSINNKISNSYVPPLLTKRYNFGLNNVNTNYNSLSYVPMPNNKYL